MNTRIIKSLKQGDVDGLCGVYSILNSLGLVLRLKSARFEPLFRKLMDSLPSASLAADGIGILRILRALSSLKASRFVRRRMPFRKNGSVSLHEYWTKLNNFLDGTPGRAAIILLGNKEGHWTVVRSMTDRQLVLSDSWKYKVLNRSNCTVSSFHKNKHMLCPASTILLEVKN